jgi:hypothetical protein
MDEHTGEGELDKTGSLYIRCVDFFMEKLPGNYMT